MAQYTSKRSVAITATSSQIANETLATVRRVQLIITNLSATTATIAIGDDAAIAGSGIILGQNQTYIESEDAAFRCWQGNIQAVASANTTLSVVERFNTEI